MKLKNVLIIVLALIYSSSFAQSEGKKHNKKKEIEAKKIAYITEKLNLSPDEAQKFWPIYNTYQSELRAISKERRSAIKGEDLSENEARTLINSKISSDKKRVELLEVMVNDLDDFLSMKKINQLFIAEHDFKKEVLDRFRKRHRSRKNKSDK